MENWKTIMSADDMTIDKGLKYHEWEGNSCLLKCDDTTGKMVAGLWGTMLTKKEFQGMCTLHDLQFLSLLFVLDSSPMNFYMHLEFFNRFTCGYSTNAVYAVEDTLGAAKLGPRKLFLDCC